MNLLVRKRRLRLAFFWVAYAIATGATALAVAGLAATVRASLAEQKQRVLREESDRIRERVDALAAGIRNRMTAELAGHHADGLSLALQRWDEHESAILGTFEWAPDRGWIAWQAVSGEMPPEGEVSDLWVAFDRWRAASPGALAGERRVSGPWVVRYVPTVGNAELPAEGLRYQAENLDVLAYAGQSIDPWAGWAASLRQPLAPWVIWYRPGPRASVRGCFVDVREVLEVVRIQIADTALVEFKIGPWDAAEAAVAVAFNELPAWRLVVSPGAVLAARQARADLSIAAVALLAGLFIVGAGGLALYSRQEARDAESKTTFVSQVSHELRTPLTSIRMFADMLGSARLDEEKRVRYAGSIARESRRLAELVERLLAFNALALGRKVVNLEVFDVVIVARQTLEEQQSRLMDAGLRIEPRLPQEPVLARSDRDALKQALLNLLDNATKYAAGGGWVRLSVAGGAGGVLIRVADGGPGVPFAQRRSLFEPFARAGGRELHDAKPGLGLGLSLSRSLLRQCGGDLRLASGDGGAVFEIQLQNPSLS